MEKTRPLDGVTLFVNSDLARQIEEEAGLQDYCGVIVTSLVRRSSTSQAVAIEDHRRFAEQLKARGIVPQDVAVRIVGLALDDQGKAGLVVNYKEK